MTASFLTEPETTPAVTALYDEDVAEDGYVSNSTRLWAHQPTLFPTLIQLASDTFRHSGLEHRTRAVVLLSAVSTLGDSYCSLAWGGKLSGWTDSDFAASVVSGSDAGLTNQERAIAAWVRRVVQHPNATTSEDVEALRATGLDDPQIFAITAFTALRVAVAMVNDALGASPDRGLVESLPRQVVDAVTWGRPPQQ